MQSTPVLTGTGPQRRGKTMRKRILFLAAVQGLVLTIPMATHAYAQGTQVAGTEAASSVAATIDPTLPWPLRGLLPL